MFADYRTAADGTELTLSTHVVAPFRLSLLLSPLLFTTPLSVIVTVSSGGMYTQRFDLDDLEFTPADYRGVTAYARAKRAQVVLAHEWDRRWRHQGVASYAMHPGWVATPGLTSSLPTVARLGPLLRTPTEGADTAVWLVAGGQWGPTGRQGDRTRPGETLGGIWLDRLRRHEYYLPSTYRRPAHRRRDGEALWEWCAARTEGGR
jgi:NAD(P)-dependent dehydrogenase (short-subunit alcohol dehydrogenase family)